MQLFRGLHNLKCLAGSVATIGNFDGVHIGHQQILQRLVQEAKVRQLPSVVICFEPQPREFFAPIEQCPARVMSFRDKLEAFQNLGVDIVLVLKFDQRLRSLSAQQFVDHVLLEHLNINWLIVGDDFRFGNDRAGDFNFLMQAGIQHGFDVVDTPTVTDNGDRISSTLLRRLISESNLYRVQKLLGKPYAVKGRVIYGQQLGRQLGVPTANIRLNMKKPAINGVYAVEVSSGEQIWQGVANVGARPTVDLHKPQIEAHLFNCEQNLYGQVLSVRFCHKIRQIQKFDDLAALKNQIFNDIQIAKDYFKLSDQND